MSFGLRLIGVGSGFLLLSDLTLDALFLVGAEGFFSQLVDVLRAGFAGLFLVIRSLGRRGFGLAD